MPALRYAARAAPTLLILAFLLAASTAPLTVHAESVEEQALLVAKLVLTGNLTAATQASIELCYQLARLPGGVYASNPDLASTLAVLAAIRPHQDSLVDKGLAALIYSHLVKGTPLEPSACTGTTPTTPPATEAAGSATQQAPTQPEQQTAQTPQETSGAEAQQAVQSASTTGELETSPSPSEQVATQGSPELLAQLVKLVEQVGSASGQQGGVTINLFQVLEQLATMNTGATQSTSTTVGAGAGQLTGLQPGTTEIPSELPAASMENILERLAGYQDTDVLLSAIQRLEETGAGKTTTSIDLGRLEELLGKNAPQVDLTKLLEEASGEAKLPSVEPPSLPGVETPAGQAPSINLPSLELPAASQPAPIGAPLPSPSLPTPTLPQPSPWALLAVGVGLAVMALAAVLSRRDLVADLRYRLRRARIEARLRSAAMRGDVKGVVEAFSQLLELIESRCRRRRPWETHREYSSVLAGDSKREYLIAAFAYEVGKFAGRGGRETVEKILEAAERLSRRLECAEQGQ